MDMKYLAFILNNLSSLKADDPEWDNPDWATLETIISVMGTLSENAKIGEKGRISKEKRLGLAADWFNKLAEKYPMPLRVTVLPKRSRSIMGMGSRKWIIHPGSERQRILKGFKFSDVFRYALETLYKNYFPPGRGWARLKKCPHCHKWFYDDTRNEIKKVCSKRCRNRWWSRDRRKKAGHKMPKYKKRERKES